MNIRLYFGHYHYPQYSTFTNNIFRLFCAVYTASVIFVYFYIYPSPLDFYYSHISYTYTLVEAIFDNLLSLILRGKYLRLLYDFINQTENMLNMKGFGVSRGIYLSLFFCFVLRVYIVLNYSPFKLSDIRCWIAGFAYLSLCVNYISKIIVFDVVYHRLKAIRIKFEFKYVCINLIGKERVKYRINNIKTCVSVYHELIYFIKNMDIEMQAWIFLTFFISFPKTIVFTHRSLSRLLKMTSFELGPFITLSVSIYTVIIACIPAVFVELAANEVDIIKEVLARNLLLCPDQDLLSETQHALDYINLLPFKYSIWRIIPVNASLPLKFAGLCVTYIIVVAQFSGITINA